MSIAKLNRPQNKTKRHVSGKTIGGAGLIEMQERGKKGTWKDKIARIQYIHI